MPTTSGVEQAPGIRARVPALFRAVTGDGVVDADGEPRRTPAHRPVAGPADPCADGCGGPRATGPSLTSLRWVFAFYGGLTFISVGTTVASWPGS